MLVPGSASPLLFHAADGGGGGYEVSRSLRFNSADSAYLSRTPGSAGSGTTWSLSFWVKKTGNDNFLFAAGSASSDRFNSGFNSSDKFFASVIDGNSTVFSITTDAVFRDPSAWYHFLLVADTTNGTQANRFKIYVNGVQQTVSGTLMPSSQNTKLNGAVIHTIAVRSYTAADYFNGYLADTILIDGQALDPTSFGEFDTNGVWQPIAYAGSYGTNGFHLDFADNSSAAALGYDAAGSNDWTVNNISVKQVTQATYNSTYGSDITAGEAAKIFDGDLTTYGVATGNFVGFSYSGTAVAVKVENTAGTSKSFYIQPWVSGSPTNSGTFNTSGTNLCTVPASTTATAVFTFPAGYDGFARLYPDGTYADLRFYDIRTAQSEAAGNDSLRDSPTNGSQTDTGVGGEVVGNYCTWNPLDCSSGSTFANGNLDVANNANTRATISVPLGAKIYFECQFTSSISKIVGFAKPNTPVPSYPGAVADSYGYQGDGFYYTSTSTVSTTSSAVGDVIMVAIDRNSHKIWFGKNGTWFGSGDPATGANAAFSSIYSSGDLAPTCGWTGNLTANFGARSFAYTAPSGFKALCTANLPAPTITNPSTVMDVKLYTGNGSTQTISGLGFSPDLVWIKKRSAAGHGPWYDSVRGIGKAITSSLTNSEYTAGSTQELTAFNSDGFSLGTDYNFDVNTSSQTFVGWCWDAGTSNATNTNGTITSTVRANISAGLSIITFTAPSSNQNFTVGHGLGIAPAFTILKRRDSSTGGDWWTWHIGLGDNTTDYLALNQTSAENSLTAMWGVTGRTSSLLGFSTPNSIVASGTYVVYAFAPVAGYSAFGSYTGNGSSTDGPFVYTGMRPRWVLIKSSSASGWDWHLRDTARDSYNPVQQRLFPNTSSAESANDPIDVLSNGFKLRTSVGDLNGSGTTYIYAAFAEHPFALARAR